MGVQQLPRAVLTSLRIWPHPPDQRHILLVQRKGSRRLGGLHSGRLRELIDAVSSQGLQVEAEMFDDLPLHRQASLAASASVLVSPHGAHLTNVMWMTQGSALIEVKPTCWCRAAAPFNSEHAAPHVQVLLRGAVCSCGSSSSPTGSSATPRHLQAT